MFKKVMKISLIAVLLSLSLILLDWGIAAFDGRLILDGPALERYALRFVLLASFIAFMWSAMVGFDNWLEKHSGENK